MITSGGNTLNWGVITSGGNTLNCSVITSGGNTLNWSVITGRGNTLNWGVITSGGNTLNWSVITSGGNTFNGCIACWCVYSPSVAYSLPDVVGNSMLPSIMYSQHSCCCVYTAPMAESFKTFQVKKSQLYHRRTCIPYLTVSTIHLPRG